MQHRKTKMVLDFVRFILFGFLFMACTKSDNSNPLVGKWLRIRVIEQYKSPISNTMQSDSISIPATLEFRSDGGYILQGDISSSYIVKGEDSFLVRPANDTYSYAIDQSGKLVTHRAGNSWEQKKIDDPNNAGAFFYASIISVLTEYQKQ